MKSAILLLLSATAVCADDGMWLFNQFPSDAVKDKYQASVNPAFLNICASRPSSYPAGRVHSFRLTGWC